MVRFVMMIKLILGLLLLAILLAFDCPPVLTFVLLAVYMINFAPSSSTPIHDYDYDAYADEDFFGDDI